MKITKENLRGNPLEISNGRHSVKIYKVQSRGRPFFQLSFYRAGRRERRTFADKGKAKLEAKAILCQLAVNVDAATEAVSTTDIESLVAARAALGGIGVPLHLAVEGFAGAVRRLCGQDGNAMGTVKLDDPVAAVHRAVGYYVKHHPVGAKRVALEELVKLYKASRKRVIWCSCSTICGTGCWRSSSLGCGKWIIRSRGKQSELGLGGYSMENDLLNLQSGPLAAVDKEQFTGVNF